MKPILPLMLAVALQWNPTVSCGCVPDLTPTPGSGVAPAYSVCTSTPCGSPTPKCGPVGMCTTASACASDQDCPNADGSPGIAPKQGACIRLDGINGGNAFCTYYVRDADVECIGGGWDFHGTSKFTPVGSTSSEKKYVCLPASFGCGDGECGLFSESLSRCPVDCVYRTCIPNGWEEPGSSCNRADYSLCIDVGIPDGGPGDAGLGRDDRLTGICVGSGQETCGADGGCLARAGYAGVCVSGLSFKPTCMQACAKTEDCLPEQRCVATPDGGASVCLPVGSRH